MNDQEIEQLFKHFENEAKIEKEPPLSIQDLDRRGFVFIEHHQNNPDLYKTTEEWQRGYIFGWTRMVDILRAKGYKEI